MEDACRFSAMEARRALTCGSGFSREGVSAGTDNLKTCVTSCLYRPHRW